MTSQELFVQWASVLDRQGADDAELVVAGEMLITAGDVRRLANWLRCRPRPKLRK